MRALLPLLLLPLAGCLVTKEPAIDPATVEVPSGLGVSDGAYRAAYVFAATRVGRADFDRLYAVNESWTRPAPLQPDCPGCGPVAHSPNELVTFDLVVHGERTWGASIHVWPDGTIADDGEPRYAGLPDCRQRSAACRFAIDKDEARLRAERAGLEPRGCPLDARLAWSMDRERFVWHLLDEPCPAPDSAEGRVFVIDAATGKVLESQGWAWIAN